jgi:hypothetical protein
MTDSIIQKFKKGANIIIYDRIKERKRHLGKYYSLFSKIEDKIKIIKSKCKEIIKLHKKYPIIYVKGLWIIFREGNLIHEISFNENTKVGIWIEDLEGTLCISHRHIITSYDLDKIKTIYWEYKRIPFVY